MRSSGAEASRELIGQFGIGFLSAFLLASEVTVQTRSADGPPLRWSSAGDDRFELAAGCRPEPGTTVELRLKASACFLLRERILLDSNLDWGQGLKRLAAYMAKEDIEEIGLAYFGHVDPALYGIAWHFPDPSRPEPAAVSANFVHGYPYATYAGGRMVPVPAEAFTWIQRFPRIAEPGGGIFVYRTGAAPPR